MVENTYLETAALTILRFTDLFIGTGELHTSEERECHRFSPLAPVRRLLMPIALGLFYNLSSNKSEKRYSSSDKRSNLLAEKVLNASS